MKIKRIGNMTKSLDRNNQVLLNKAKLKQYKQNQSNNLNQVSLRGFQDKSNQNKYNKKINQQIAILAPINRSH